MTSPRRFLPRHASTANNIPFRCVDEDAVWRAEIVTSWRLQVGGEECVQRSPIEGGREDCGFEDADTVRQWQEEASL